ncbi:hypothetical protein GCM10022280_19540 [Sphingomonas swuensis]|uniref:Uncharacterized protein n=1 Tax=Sphingomonas swuensis TaxID=977800 RepID=A0ABP7T1R3_9SPHN
MATAAAALAARARREIQHHFFAADAVRPERAVSFVPDNRFERRLFERYRTEGVLHEEQPGRYWIDLPSYDRAVRRRFERVRWIVFALLALLVLLAAIGSLTGHVR